MMFPPPIMPKERPYDVHAHIDPYINIVFKHSLKPRLGSD